MLTALFTYILGFALFLVLTQDLNIFPGAYNTKLMFWSQRNKEIPREVESIFIPSKDGTRLEVWHYRSELQTPLSKYVAVVFHGNGGAVENFLFVHMWFAELGISSYGFDYRGFGRSSGWPNEKGIYLDSDAAWEYVCEREKLPSSQMISVGISLGGAPAARIAALHQPKLLLLSSAFTDLRRVVGSRFIIGLLAPFVWSKFPTIDFIRQLKETNLVIAHGDRDSTVSHSHAAELEQAYSGSGEVRKLISRDGGHNMAFFDLKDELKVAVTALL